MRFAFFLFAATLQAQSTAGSIAPAWDTGRFFTEVAAQSARLQPLLRQIKPQDWPAAGAPATYVTLWDSAIKDNAALPASAAAVATSPERLADSVKLLLSIQRVQATATQLLEGVRKYQNPALAELIAGTMEEGRPAREAFEQRVVDLATEREHQFDVADHEAQRCREFLSKQPFSRSPHGVKSK